MPKKVVSLRTFAAGQQWLVTFEGRILPKLLDAGPMATPLLDECLRLEKLGFSFEWRLYIKSQRRYVARPTRTLDVRDDHRSYLESLREMRNDYRHGMRAA